MKFAKTVFWIAAVYGILVITPLYFMEEMLSKLYPPPLNHPEHFYTFVSVTLVWQILFVFVALNPIRLRPIMIPCILEKVSVLPVFFILNAGNRFPEGLFFPFLIDLALGMLFTLAYYKTRNIN